MTDPASPSSRSSSSESPFLNSLRNLFRPRNRQVRRRQQRKRNRRHTPELQLLEDRVLLAAFSEAGSQLDVDMNVADKKVTIVNLTSGGYLLTLDNDTWQGTDTASVTGNGTSSLTVTPAGLSQFDTVRVTDSAAGARVTFRSSGANEFNDSFIVDLDDSAAGTVILNTSRFAGTASLSVSTTRDIFVGEQIRTVDGAITLRANQQATPTQGNFSGIEVSGVVEATGTGQITLEGRAGAGSTNGALGGVKISGNGKIQGGTAGTLRVAGQAGSGSGAALIGVFLTDTAAISSLGANVEVIGVGGAGAGLYNYGVGLDPGTTLSPGGTGTVSVVGTGGAGGSFHSGVALNGGTITSGGGDVSITGKGGGSGAASDGYGVFVVNNGKATAGGSGNVTVQGTGGAGSGVNNDGVRLAAGGSSTITSAGGKITVTGQPGTSTGTGLVIENTISHTGSGTSGEIEIATDSIMFSGSGAINAGPHTVTVHPATANKSIQLGGAGTGGLNLTDAQLDRITAGTLVIGDNTARKISLTGNVTRPTRTNVQIRTKESYKPGSFTIDPAGGRVDVPTFGPPNFSQLGTTFVVDLNVANSNLAISSDGTNYVLTLTGATWSGTSSYVTGSGSGTLLITPSGKNHFDKFLVTDSAKGTSVTFNDSGTNTYSDSFEVQLDEVGAGTITFTGKTTFAGNGTAPSLTAITSRDIVVSSGATVQTKDGALLLRANGGVPSDRVGGSLQATQGDFSGITVAGTVGATGKGSVTIDGRAGARSTSSEIAGVKVDGGNISGGKSGSLTVSGGGGQGTGGKLFGVWVANSGKITSAGSDVSVRGKGGRSTGLENHGVLVSSSSEVSAGGGGIVTIDGTSARGKVSTAVGQLSLTNATAVGGNASTADTGAAKAIDRDPGTQFANTGGAGSGLEVEISGGPALVSELEFTTASERPGLDPAAYTLEGKKEDGSYVTIVDKESISLPLARRSALKVSLNNGTAYSTYRLTFPSLRNPAEHYMFLGEVRFFGSTQVDSRVGSGTIVEGGTVTSSGGNVSLSGHGQRGVVARNRATITAGGSGTILVNGRAAIGAGSNHGVLVTGNARITSNSGTLVLTGVPGKNSGNGVLVDAAVSHSGTDSGIALITDSLDITASGSVDAGSNSVAIKPLTRGIGIDLGGEHAVRHKVRHIKIDGDNVGGGASRLVDGDLSNGWQGANTANVTLKLSTFMTPVTHLRLSTSGNREGDPTYYMLEGQLPDGSFELVSAGSLALPDSRGTGVTIQLNKPSFFVNYRLRFPSSKGQQSQSWNLGEIELLSADIVTDIQPVTSPTDKISGGPAGAAEMFDDDTSTGFDFSSPESFELTLSQGPGIVQGVRITDASGRYRFRDVKLEGKNADGSRETLAEITPYYTQGTTETHFFPNAKAFTSYYITVEGTEFRGKTSGIAELELLQIDVSGALDVSDGVLDRVSASTLRVGDFRTNAIVVSTDLSRSTRTDIQISSGQTIDRGGKTIGTAGGYLRVNQSGLINDGPHVDRGGLRFITTGTFTNDATDSPVQVGFQPSGVITSTQDTVSAFGGPSPSNEDVTKAFDNQNSTKYLNLGGVGSGLEVTPAKGSSVVTALRFTTGNDAPDRDPAGYKLEGKNSSGSYVKISSGDLALPQERGRTTTIQISNTTAYTTYRLTFTKLKDNSQQMQIAEIALLNDGFRSLLHLPNGVRIQGDKFSTAGKVSAITGDGLRDLFTGVVDGDPNQRLVIPISDLIGKGFDIPSGQSATFSAGAKTGFTSSQVKLVQSGVPQIELNGTLRFDALNGAGVRIGGTDRLVLNSNGFELDIKSPTLNVEASQIDPGGKGTPITFSLAGSDYQAEKLSINYEASSKRFYIIGAATSTFEGGRMEVAFSGKTVLRDATRPLDSVTEVCGIGACYPQGNKEALFNNNFTDEYDYKRSIDHLRIHLSSGAQVVRGLRVHTSAKGAPSRNITIHGVDSNGRPKLIGDFRIPTISPNSASGIFRLNNTQAYSTYRIDFDWDYHLSELELLAEESGLYLQNGSFPDQTRGVEIRSLALGSVDFSPDNLTLRIDQTTNKARIEGRSTPGGQQQTSSKIDFGPVGFGVDADLNDADTRIGAIPQIRHGRLDSFAIPLVRLANSTYQFTNIGTDQSKFMWAEYDAVTGTYRITGETQKMLRKGSLTGIDNSQHNELTAIVRMGFPGDDGDVTQAGDTITHSGKGYLYNGANAVDDDTSTEFRVTNGSLEVNVGQGAAVVTGLRFSKGRRQQHNFPHSYKLEGKSGNNSYTEVHSGSVTYGRQGSAVVWFPNTVAYSSYRLTLDLRPHYSSTDVTLGEVALLASPIDLTKGTRIVNGRLEHFRISVKSLSLQGNATNKFTFTESNRNGLVATYNEELATFRIEGTANVAGPTEVPKTSDTDNTFRGKAAFGTLGSTGIILNGKNSTRDHASFALREVQLGGTTFRGKDMLVTYDPAAKAFKYTGSADWLFDKQVIPATIVGSSSVPSTLSGFELHRAVKFRDLTISNVAVKAHSSTSHHQPSGRHSRVLIVNGRNGNATIKLEGKVTPVTPQMDLTLGRVGGSQSLLTPARFSLSGFNLDNPRGILHFPKTSRNSSSSFAYEVGSVDFKIGDVSGKTRASLLLNLKDGALTLSDKATFTFGAITIQDIEFSENALTASYSLTDKRFTFEGKGKYLGLTDVTVGVDPSNPQLIEERGVFKLTNFTPPAVDFKVSGVVFATQGKTEADKLKPVHTTERVTYTGTRTISVGGAQVTLGLGANGTRGLVYNKTTRKMEHIEATVSGTFTVGGVGIELTSGTLGYDAAKNEFTISGSGKFNFLASAAPMSVQINLDKLIIKDGEITDLTASVSAGVATGFRPFGLIIEVDKLGIKYTADKQEYGLFGSVKVSTVPVGGQQLLDEFQLSMGAGPNAPGLVIKQGELESFDFALNGTINLAGLSATPEQLRLKYNRATNVLGLTGGVTVTIANKFTATAAFPGDGLLIDTQTGKADLRGLHLSVGDVKFGALEIRKVAFTYLVDSNGNTTITGEGEVALPGNITVGAEIEIRNNRLRRIGILFERLPGIQIGNTGVFLYSISGELKNLDDLKNFEISATVKATGGPGVKIFGETRALLEVDGTISINKDRLKISGNVQLLGGVLGDGSGEVTVFFSGQEVIDAKAEFTMYGGIFKGNLSFKLDRDFNLRARSAFELRVPDGIKYVGGKKIGSLNAWVWIWPKKARHHSAVWVDGEIKVGPVKVKFGVGVDFTGKVYGGVSALGNSIDFSFRLPGIREFTIPELDELIEQLAQPTLDILSVSPAAGTPGATVTFSGTTELPDDTTIDLYVDTNPDSYGGHAIASGLPFGGGEQTFSWDDLAAYAPIPYDPNKPLYVYGAIDDGSNFPVFTAYSAPIVPPDYTPSIDVPPKADYGTNQDLIFSEMTGNAITVTDPLAAAVPDAEIQVDVSAGHGRLELIPENARPWQHLASPTDVDQDGSTSVLDILKVTDLLNNPDMLDGGAKLPTTRSSVSDMPYYDVNGDGLVTSTDVSMTARSLAGISNIVATSSGTAVDVDGDGTESITLIGRAADINEILDGLTYHPYENSFFNDEISISLNRYPAFYNETIDAAIPVMANALTLGTRDGSALLPVTYEQGSGHQTLLGGVDIQNAASGRVSGATISIGNYEQGKDLLELNIEDQMDLGIDANFDAATGTLRLSGTATVAEYESALHLLSFCSTGTGEKTLTVSVGDNVNGQSTLTQAVQIIAVNQPPIVDPGMGAVYEIGGSAVRILESAAVQDPEGGDISHATITLDPATYVRGEDVLDFIGQPGIRSKFDEATGTLSLTGPASAFEYTLVLQNVTYHNTATTPTTGIRELSILVSDGAARNAETTVHERLIVVNAGTNISAPVIGGLPTGIVDTPLGSDPVVLAPDLTLTAPDPLVPTLMNAIVRIGAGFTPGADMLNAKGLPDGIEASYDPIHGVLVLSGSAPISHYEYALRQVTYSNQETVRNGLQRSLEFDVNDGFTIATPGELTLEPASVPVVEVGFGALVYETGQRSVSLNPNVVVKYEALPILTGAKISFVWGYQQGQDFLEYTEIHSIDGVFDETTGVMTFTGTATLEEYQEALRSVQYHNSRVNPIPGQREVKYTLLDDQKSSDAAESMMSNFVIDVATNYVPPTLTLDATAVTFVENSDPLAIAATFTITDPDTPMADGSGALQIDGATVHIDGYVEGEDFLAFTAVAGIEGEFDPELGQLTLAGQASLADYQTLLRSVTYQNVSEAPTTDVRRIQMTVFHGAVDGAAPLLTIDVQSLNNPPIRTSAAPTDVTAIENLASISLGLESVSYDPPSAKEPNLVYTVDIVPDAQLGHVEVADGTVAQVGESYTLDQLRQAVFVPALNSSGTAQFTYTVAGWNPILDQVDPAHLSESVSISVVGIDTLTPSDAFEAQVYRDLLNRNPTQAELDATPDDFMIDTAAREQFIGAILNSTDYESLQIARMFEELLGRPASPGEIDALYLPPHALSEDFSGTELPASLQASDGSAIAIENGSVTFNGARNFVRTALSEYSVNDFTAEVTVTVGGDSSVTAEEQIVYFGMGSGEPDAGNDNEPNASSLVQMRIGPDGFLLGGAGLVDVKDNSVVTESTSAVGGSGTHRLRLTYNGGTETATFSIDQDYAGGDFVADHTFTGIDASDNLFDLDNAKIFFGGSGNTTFDDFVISGAPIDLKLDEVKSRIIASDEYYQERGSGTHEGFVQAAYEDLVGREATQAEIDHQVEVLNGAGARIELATLLANGNEGAVKQVETHIQDLLRRKGELFEVVDYARQLQSNGAGFVVTDIVASDEYFTRYGTQTSADSRSAEEIEQELILQWLLGEGVAGNSVETTDFEAVGIIGDGYTGRGGGTLIGSEYVLTAAHLVAGHDTHDLRFSVGATSYGVTQVEIHPGYNPSLVGTDGGHDIAVLRLNRPVVDVTPASLHTGEVAVGEMLTLVGFGAHPGDDQFGTKRVGTTPIDGVTPNLVTWTYDDDSEATTVPGDSGSPQFVVNDAGDYVVASVASGGTHQASAIGDFAYNTRVDSYIGWIASVVGGAAVGPVPIGLESADSEAGATAGGNRPYETALTGGPRSHGGAHNVELQGDHLSIRDLSNGGVNDDLSITTTATHVVIRSSVQTLTVDVSNATGDGTNTISVPLSAFSGGILVDTGAGDDTLYIETPSRLVTVDGGVGTNRLVVEGSSGTEDEEFFIRESATTAGVLEVDMPGTTAPGPYRVLANAIQNLQLDTFAGNDTVRPQDLSGLTTTLQSLVINLGDGDDVLAGENATTAIQASGGNGADTMRGGSANDTLEGNDGDDSLTGGPGDDTYKFNVDRPLGSDTVTENTGEGTDTLDFSATAATTIGVDLRSTALQNVDLTNRLQLTLTDDIENIIGGSNGNVLVGDAGANVLTGGPGIDVLLGMGGDDTLNGAGGNDQLIGQGAGAVLVGGDDIDSVEFSGVDVSFPTNTAAAFDLAGTVPGTSHDQILVQGDPQTVSLNSATLMVNTTGFSPQPGDEFMIVDLVAAASTISGTFNFNGQPLAQGATFVANGREFTIDYQAGDGNDVVLTFQQQLPAFTIMETGGATSVSESGTTDTFSVVLDKAPTLDVVLSVSSADTDEATVSSDTLIFSPSDWNTPQTVTVTGVSDQMVDGDRKTLITVSVDDALSDFDYGQVADQTLEVTTTDTNRPGIDVSETDASTLVSETGTTDQFDVVLDTAPTSDVVLNVSSGDTGEANVTPATLTFTAANWDTPQTVTVTGTADGTADGNQTTDITISVDDAASDDAYDPAANHTVSVTTTDADVAGITITETGGTTSVDETGTSDTFDVVLNTAPVSDVILNVASADTGEATVAPATLTFTPANWNVAQTVTATGVADNTVDGDQSTAVTVSVDAAASDDAFDALLNQTVSVTTTDVDVPSFTITETDGSTTVNEAGGTDTISVVLDAAPTSDVVLNISSGDTGEAVVTPATLTFTPSNWNTAQTIGVVGVSDGTVDGDQTTTVTVSVDDAASDDAYDSAADQTVSVATTDADVPGITITKSGGTASVSETGTSDTFDVVLDSAPVSDVILNVSSADTSEATVTPATLTFTPANWNVAQTVTATGVSDTTVDGDQTTSVTVSVDAAASDDAFDTLADQTVTVTTTDVDVPGFTVTETDGSTGVAESGGTDTLEIVLNSAPVTDVVLKVSSADTGEVSVTPAVLTFTSANWNVAQTVGVVGVSDGVVDGNQTTTVTVSVDAAASDDAFDALGDQTVTVTTTDTTDLPTVTGPLGISDSVRPTLTWNAVDGASSYEVWLELIGGSQNPVARPTVEGTSYTLPTDLGVGRYRTWVRGNLSTGGRTPWARAEFRINTAAVLHSVPRHGQDLTPAITWDPVLGATSYRVYISSSTTSGAVLDEIVTGTTLTPNRELSFGRHRIWVRAIGFGNYGAAWSNPAIYNIGPSLTGPIGSTFNLQPQFTWTSLSGIATYELQVRKGSTVVISETGLTGTSYTPATPLAVGAYRWWIRPYDATGNAGAWSAAGEFFAGGRPAVSSPSGTIDDSTPTVTWDAVDGAGTYEIYVFHDGGAGLIHRETGITQTRYSLTPLSDGDYRVWVKTYDTAGDHGLWSAAQRFTVDAATVTTTAVPQSPVTPTFETTPAFTWSAAADAISYDLYLAAGQTVISETGITGTTWTPSAPLAADVWQWWVRPITAAGAGPWSEATTDTSGRPALLSPTGTTGSQTPSITWTPVAGASHYTVHVDNLTTGTPAVIRDDNVTGTTLTVASPLTPGNYRVWVRAISGNGNTAGPWSFRMDFTVTAAEQADSPASEVQPQLTVLQPMSDRLTPAEQSRESEQTSSQRPRVPESSAVAQEEVVGQPFAAVQETSADDAPSETVTDEEGIDRLMSEFTRFAISDTY